MSTTTPNKTAARALLAHTQLATGTIAVGTEVDVSTMFAVRVFIDCGRTVATALTGNVLFKLQASSQASNNDGWATIAQVTMANGTTAANAPTLSGGTSAGASTFAVSSATGIAAGDTLYLRETGTPANSEWTDVKSMSGTTVTPNDNLTRAHTNGITITDLAERLTWTEDVSSYKRLRLIADAATNASGQTVDVIAWLVSLDSLSTA